jgi:integrase
MDARQQLIHPVAVHCRCSWLAENGKWTLQTRRNVRTVPRFPMLSALAPHGTQRRWKAWAYQPTSCQPAANQQVSNKGRSKSNSSRHPDRHNCRTVSCSELTRGQQISGGSGLGGVEGSPHHDLRHTCASLAVSSGANVLAVSRMLGHKDPSITLRIYADLFDSDLDAVAVNLDAKIASSVQACPKHLSTVAASVGKPLSSCADVSCCCVSEGGLEPPRPLVGH